MARKPKKYDRFFSAFKWSYSRALEAKKDGYLIESLILVTAHIDALLRILIYQKSQIEHRTTRVRDDDLFIQKPRDRNYPYGSERKIIEKAYIEKVIDKTTKNSLLAFLVSRNNFIHRLFLGNWKYAQLNRLIDRGNKHVKNLQERSKKLAEKQVKSGILAGPAFTKKAPQEWENLADKTVQELFD